MISPSKVKCSFTHRSLSRLFRPNTHLESRLKISQYLSIQLSGHCVGLFLMYIGYRADSSAASSSSNDPVLHFILFIPSAKRRPLDILKDDGK